MNNEMKGTVANYLRCLGSGEKESGTLGICMAMYDIFGYAIEMEVQNLMRSWPEADLSSKGYVVPHPTLTAEYGFNFTDEQEKFWTGEYGASRKRLCMWLANELEPLDGCI